MKMLNAPEGAWLYGSMFPTWSGYRKGATAQQIPARFNATDVPKSGFGLVQHCTKLGSRALTLPRENDSDRPYRRRAALAIVTLETEKPPIVRDRRPTRRQVRISSAAVRVLPP